MNEHSNSRRQFLGGLAAASVLGPLMARAQTAPAPGSTRKIKIGIIGCGGRGSWIAGLFQKNGGYEIHAVADYFQEAADKCGDALGVDKSRRFSGLSAYKKLIESGVEAVALETPTYFLPGHATAATEAGLHVYMAKPVAPDVPGCLAIEAAGKRATEKKQVFFVDYQIPTEPGNIEIIKRIHDGGIGKLTHIQTFGVGSGSDDPPKTATIEDRLQNLIWVHDVALGCDYIGNFDIHAIDAALWAVGERPIAAAGFSSIVRPDAHGDSSDVCSVVYQYANGLVHNHFGQAIKDLYPGCLEAIIHGETGHAQINYWGKSFLRGGSKQYNAGEVKDLYPAGAERNIATFHDLVTTGNVINDTVRRSVDGCLTCILGREAAARHITLTMDQLLKENKKLEVSLEGLKA